MEDRKSVECCIPDSPHMRAVGRLLRIMRHHHACVERQIGDLGIHHSQQRMLMHLARHRADMPSQGRLAEVLGISPAAVTATLQRLEREGYIARSTTDEDNRKNEIRITEQGLSKVVECRAVFEATDRAMFAGFSEEEMETLLSLLTRMDENLDAMGVSGSERGEGEA